MKAAVALSLTCLTIHAATNAPVVPGIMPPPIPPSTNQAKAAPMQQLYATLVWSNSLPFATGWSNNITSSVWSNAPLPHGSYSNEVWYSNGVPVITNTGTNWFYYGGGSICFTNPKYNYVPVTNYLDLIAASNDLRTGLATITNLHYPTNGVLRTNLPFALSSKVALRMTNSENLRAFWGPKSK